MLHVPSKIYNIICYYCRVIARYAHYAYGFRVSETRIADIDRNGSIIRACTAPYNGVSNNNNNNYYSVPYAKRARWYYYCCYSRVCRARGFWSTTVVAGNIARFTGVSDKRTKWGRERGGVGGGGVERKAMYLLHGLSIYHYLNARVYSSNTVVVHAHRPFPAASPHGRTHVRRRWW